MGDNWDDEDYTPPEIPKPKVNEFGDEDVKESWEELTSETSAAHAQPSGQEPKKPKQDKKKKEKIAAVKTVDAVGETKQLTQQELEELQRKGDLAITQEMFGSTTEESGLNFTNGQQGPTNKEDFELYAKWLTKEITKHQTPSNKPEYFAFLSNLFRELTINLDYEHVRTYGKELTALANELHKKEKEDEKNKAGKTKVKPTVKVGTRKMDLLDDYGDVAGEAGGYDDDEDFM